jgi:hemerythrin-like domain-containing protein
MRMTPTAIQIIKDEHLAIAAVLYSLRYLVRQIRDQGAEPDFRLLHAILDYIVEYPERWHHPKEDEYLFKTLRERSTKAHALIDELEAEHIKGGPLVNELKQTLVHYEAAGKTGFDAFAAAVEEYADFHWKHMRKEEDILMPLAEKSLTEEDWQRIGDAFKENDNPLFGIKPKEEAELLFQRILSLAPAPIGFGPAKR